LQPVLGGLTFQRIAVGRYHTCGLSDGTIYCWGGEGYGELGDGPPAVGVQTSMVRVGAAGDYVDVDADYQNTCAIRRDSAVDCWGLAYDDAWDTAVDGPQIVGQVNDARFLSVGSRDACVTTASGELHCLGVNKVGELGDGESFLLTPTPLPDL
jgi:alpha-tubulin suppressor-like RCC1 family protein